MLFNFDEEKPYINLYKLMEEICSGQGRRWDQYEEDDEKRTAHVVLEKSEINEVRYSKTITRDK